MNAWQRLLAASSLAIGSAWDLITHPKTGGSGTGVVVNTGAVALVNDTSLAVALSDGAISVALGDKATVAVVRDTGYFITVADNKTEVLL